MNEFNEQEYWQNRYVKGGNSGAGSYDGEALFKAHFINYWVEKLEINTINEIGSGDGNNLQYYKIPEHYTGYDFSPEAIAICQKKIDNPKYFFTSDINNMDYNADLCLCLDVWYHQISDKTFDDLCNLLFVVGKWKYIIIYSTDTDCQYTEDGIPLAKHVKFRPVLDKVKEFPEWEVLHWVSGYQTTRLPSLKKMFILKRNEDNS